MPVLFPLILRRPRLSSAAPLFSRPESPFFLSPHLLAFVCAAPRKRATLTINLKKIVRLSQRTWEFHELAYPYAFKAQPAPYAPSLYFGGFT
jgi:hypothetical protein